MAARGPDSSQGPACSSAHRLLRLDWWGLSQRPVPPRGPLLPPPPSSLKSFSISAAVSALPFLWPHKQIHRTWPEGFTVTTLIVPESQKCTRRGAHETTAPFTEALGLPGTFRGLGRGLTLPLVALGGVCCLGALLSIIPGGAGALPAGRSEQRAGRTCATGPTAPAVLVPRLGARRGPSPNPDPAVALPEQALAWGTAPSQPLGQRLRTGASPPPRHAPSASAAPCTGRSWAGRPDSPEDFCASP